MPDTKFELFIGYTTILLVCAFVIWGIISSF